MSTEYEIHPGVYLGEHSCKVDLYGSVTRDGYAVDLAADITDEDLRKMIVKMVHVLSYISDDPEEVLKRFNVGYEDQR